MRSLSIRSFLTGIAISIAAMSGAGAGESPYTGSLNAGLAYEKSQSPVVRIDNTAAVNIGGQSSVEDLYKNLTFSFSANTPCGPLSCTGDISLESHIGQRSAEFNTQFTRISAGVGAPIPASIPLLGNANLGIQVLAEDWRVANAHFRTVTGGMLNLIWLDARLNATLLSMELSRFKHNGDNTLLDANYLMASLSHNHHIDSISADASVQISLSDERDHTGGKYLDNQAAMARISLEKQVSERWRLGGALTAQKIGFGADDPLAGQSRHDLYFGRELFAESTLSERFKLRGSWSDSRYTSSISMYENRWNGIEISLTATF